MTETGRNPEPQVGDVWEWLNRLGVREDDDCGPFTVTGVSERSVTLCYADGRYAGILLRNILADPGRGWRRVSTKEAEGG